MGTDNPEAKGLERARRHGIPSFVVDYSRIHPFVEGLRAFGPIFRYEEKEIEKDENFDTNDIIRI